MTKIKLCGLTRLCDIETANELKPEYIGFVFAPQSRRYLTLDAADALKKQLDPDIQAVGVFVNEKPETIVKLVNSGTIDIVQLHGDEDEAYIAALHSLISKPIIKAFRIESKQDILSAQHSSADYILLDSGTGGTGTVFDWKLIGKLDRPYFLAGGLDGSNIEHALKALNHYAVDVSSGIETNGLKDKQKMIKFVHAVRTSRER